MIHISASRQPVCGAISVWIGDGGPAGIPSAQPDQIAPVYWEMHEARDRAETHFTA